MKEGPIFPLFLAPVSAFIHHPYLYILYIYLLNASLFEENLRLRSSFTMGLLLWETSFKVGYTNWLIVNIKMLIRET